MTCLVQLPRVAAASGSQLCKRVEIARSIKTAQVQTPAALLRLCTHFDELILVRVALDVARVHRGILDNI